MSLTDADMRLLKQLASEQTGVVIDPDKYELVQARLTHVVHLNNLGSVDQLMHLMHHRPQARLNLEVSEALLTNETQFFREPQIYKSVKEILQNDTQQEYQIWSAACSSGQEPYSLAMMLTETKELQNKQVSILASDISQKALKQAESGVYSEFELSRGLAATQRRQHFRLQRGDWLINADVRSKVRFQRINLNKAWPVIPKMDMVFLRNVLIYFDFETKVRLVDRIKKQLKPNGYLIVGTGETPDKVHPGFEKVKMDKNYVYRCLQ